MQLELPLPDRDELSRRSAVSSTPIEKIGNSFAVGSAPNRSRDGKQQIHGADTIDLGEIQDRMGSGPA